MFQGKAIIIERYLKVGAYMVGKVDFSKRLRDIIDDRNIRQSDLCEKTGIGKSAMSQYLSGAFKPKQQNLYKLAKVLNVSEAWLMGYDVPMEHSKTPEKETGAFYFYMNDDSMIGAHIPPGAQVLIRRSSHVKNQQIIACMIESVIMLRRFNQIKEHIILTPENSNYMPSIFSKHELDGAILGIATQVIIDL